jgi:threonine aldolase
MKDNSTTRRVSPTNGKRHFRPAGTAIIPPIMRRRNFLATPLAGFQLAAISSEKPMHASGDGIPHTPEEYAQLLAGLAKSGDLTPDEYSRGGVVEKLEARMASLLGKEAAI